MPLNVLIVEDEIAIALLIEDAVEASGHVVAHSVTNIREAMHVAATGHFDVALLDLNLNGQKAHGLPVTLKARGKPFGFITGYGQAGVLPIFGDAPLLSKPFQEADIGNLLNILEKQLQRAVD